MTDLEEKMTALEAAWQYEDRRATAFNEVRILDRMGREGWEMIGFGVGVLRFRRPDEKRLRVRWSYHRTEGILHTAERERLESEGWVYCGSWMGVFHYFKRAAS